MSDILFLADDRDLHQAIIAEFGDRVHVVYDWDMLCEAIDNKIGHILMDGEYERQSGYVVAEALADRVPMGCKIILISNEVSINEAEKASYAGIDAVLVTPFDRQALWELL